MDYRKPLIIKELKGMVMILK